MRLIDANLAQHIANTELSYNDAGKAQWVLSHTPTVDAIPVRHGRVVTTSDRWCVFHQNCSECGADLPWKEYPNYCYNCGAKLDLEG